MVLNKNNKEIRRLYLCIYALAFLLIIVGALSLYNFNTYSSLYSRVLSLSNHTTISNSSHTLVQVNTTVGQRLTNIDVPFNSSELSIINNGPSSYYELAGLMLLNNTLQNSVFLSSVNKSNVYNSIIINGKPSVIYIGALSCIFCGENRWAMALALSRFGNFTKLYKGYSSFGDGDLPTIYWNNYNYTTSSNVGYGNYYTSKYINFLSADYESPVRLGFEMKPISFFVQHAPNATYFKAMNFMNSSNKYQGTPFVLWGNVIYEGADAVILGNNTPSAPPYPLELMSHADVLRQLQTFNSSFAYSEYAAADVYISYICSSINNNASVCSLPAIHTIEQLSNLS